MTEHLHYIDHTKTIEFNNSTLSSPNRNFKLLFDEGGTLKILNTESVSDPGDGDTLWELSNPTNAHLQSAKIDDRGCLSISDAAGTSIVLPTDSQGYSGEKVHTRLYLENSGRLMLATMQGEKIHTLIWDSWDNESLTPHYEVYAESKEQVYTIGGEKTRKLLMTPNQGELWEITSGDDYEKLSVFGKKGTISQTHQEVSIATKGSKPGFSLVGTGLALQHHQYIGSDYIVGLTPDGTLNCYKGNALKKTIGSKFASFSVTRNTKDLEDFVPRMEVIWAITQTGEISRHQITYIGESCTVVPGKGSLISPGSEYEFIEISALSFDNAWAIRKKKTPRAGEQNYELVRIVDSKVVSLPSQVPTPPTDLIASDPGFTLTAPPAIEFLKVSAVDKYNAYAISKDYLLWRTPNAGKDWFIVLTNTTTIEEFIQKSLQNIQQQIAAKHEVEKVMQEAFDRMKGLNDNGVSGDSDCLRIKVVFSHTGSLTLFEGLKAAAEIAKMLKFLPPPIPTLLSLALKINAAILKARYEGKGKNKGMTISIPWVLLTPAISAGAVGVSALVQIFTSIHD